MNTIPFSYIYNHIKFCVHRQKKKTIWKIPLFIFPFSVGFFLHCHAFLSKFWTIIHTAAVNSEIVLLEVACAFLKVPKEWIPNLITTQCAANCHCKMMFMFPLATPGLPSCFPKLQWLMMSRVYMWILLVHLRRVIHGEWLPISSPCSVCFIIRKRMYTKKASW